MSQNARIVEELASIDGWFSPSSTGVSLQRNRPCITLAEKHCPLGLRNELVDCQARATTAAESSRCVDKASDDCVFQTAAGPDACGTRIAGTEAVRKAFAAAWQAVPDAQWENGVHFVSGEFGTSQWTFTGTAADGSRIETDGIDVFTFRDGKIALKNVFRKVRPNLPAAK